MAVVRVADPITVTSFLEGGHVPISRPGCERFKSENRAEIFFNHP